MNEIVRILMERDGVSEQEACEAVEDAKEELQERLADSSMGDPYEICADCFGLEPDYIMDLI